MMPRKTISQIHLRITFLIVALLLHSAGWGKVTIRGKIDGYDGKSLIYYHPTIEGIYTPYWKELNPLHNGTFKIEFENPGFGNTTISYKEFRYRFFHDTDSQIYFEIRESKDSNVFGTSRTNRLLLVDSLKKAGIVRISGDYEAINKFYNKNLRSSYSTTHLVDGHFYSRLILNSASPSSALAILDSLKQIEIDQINQMPISVVGENPSVEVKEKEVRAFLINEVHAFYGAVFLNGMFLKRKEQVIASMADSTVDHNIYNREWEVLIEEMYDQAKLRLKPAPNSPDYADFMESIAYAIINYRYFHFPQSPTISLDEEMTNRLFKYDTSLFHDQKVRFAHELKGIQRFLNDQLYYSPALLSAVYELQSRNPTSDHLKFYENKIERLRSSLEVSKQDFKDGKIIRGKYTSFDGLLERFAGSNVLIDIWATWCPPCIEDFRHKKVLQPFIENDKIELLYISIDKSQWEDRWRQSIKINELQGNHFRADKIFIEDMWNALGGFKGAIPRYVLVDAKGKIFKSTAARPSDGSKLVQEIKLMTSK